MKSSPRRRPSSSPDDLEATDGGGPTPEVPDYSRLSGDYHWMYDDVDLKLGTRTPGVRAALRSLPENAAVLDVACGIGLDARGLANRGLRVSAADASAEMVALTRSWVSGCDRVPRVLQSTWLDLHHHFAPQTFDAVLCTGNSISHARSSSEMSHWLRSFRSMLSPGGMLVLDVQDWDAIRNLGDRLIVDPHPIERNGGTCRRSWTWRFPPDQQDQCHLDIGFEVTRDHMTTVSMHSVELRMFDRSELRSATVSAGFGNPFLDRVPGDGMYTMVAYNPDDPHSPDGPHRAG